jgi:tetratricopeptide (TPR) repeat protein
MKNILAVICLTLLLKARNSPECEAAHRQALTLLAEGRNADAEELLSPLVSKLSTPQDDNVCLATMLGDLASAFQRLGRFVAAENATHRSLTLIVESIETTLGPHDPLLSHPLQMLAKLAIMDGQMQKAAELVSRAELLALTPSDRAATRGLRAGILAHQGKLADSEREYRLAISEWENADKAESLEAVPDLSNLAVVYIKQGRVKEALTLLERCLRIVEIPPYDLNLRVTTLLTIANAHAKSKEREHADLYFLKAIDLVGGERLVRPDLARVVYSAYAEHLRNTGRKGKAHDLDQQALALFGPNPPTSIVDVDSLKLKLP